MRSAVHTPSTTDGRCHRGDLRRPPLETWQAGRDLSAAVRNDEPRIAVAAAFIAGEVGADRVGLAVWRALVGEQGLDAAMQDGSRPLT